MRQYQVTLEGLTPLLLHGDNIVFTEKVKAWQNAPENKAQSVAGDDRSPPWTWIGSIYHDGKNLGVNADNLMTMLREGGKKVRTGKGQETFKAATQSGLMIDQQQWDINVGKTIPVKPIKALIGNTKFEEHLETVEGLGFELLVKRAKIGRSKHVRVRPLFRTWAIGGTITVFDEELSGLSKDVLLTILNQAGALCGIGDWRPSSPASGSFGKFKPTVSEVK